MIDVCNQFKLIENEEQIITRHDKNSKIINDRHHESEMSKRIDRETFERLRRIVQGW